MLEFEILQELEPNAEILEIIKDCKYTVKNGRIKHLKATNLQFIEPTEYVIKYSVGSMNCKLVAFKCLILPFLTV